MNYLESLSILLGVVAGTTPIPSRNTNIVSASTDPGHTRQVNPTILTEQNRVLIFAVVG